MRRKAEFAWLAIAVSLVLTALGHGTSAAEEGYLRFPTISGNDVVFSCEGDLWGVSVEGGTARRLTQGEGAEILPHLSPDGRLVAFTAEYEGNNDVYVIPSDGGEAKRLTYHPYSDQVIGWTRDGAYVLARSMRQSAQPVYKPFKVPVGGGAAEALPLDKVGTLSFAPDGHRVAFTRTATEFRTWKRYKGGTAQDVWVGDFDNMQFTKITDYVGTDGYPLWVEDRIYFASDRDGVMNMYSTDTAGGDLRQHTHHTDYDVRWPSYASGRIIYECGGDLWILEVASNREHKMAIDLRSDRVETRPRYVEPAKYVTDFRLSPEGLRVAFCSRGDLEIVPTKEGRLIEIAEGSAQREKFPRWTGDGKNLVYISDATGEEEIYMVDGERKAAPKQLTKNTDVWKFAAVPSPDGKKIAYADATFRLFVIDMETGWRVAVDSSAVWEIERYSWSPDSKWLAYEKPEDFRFSSVFIYDTVKSKITRVTDKFTNDTAPAWDPEGKYLYFFSDRTLNPFLSKRGFEMILDKMTKPYLVMLRAGEKSPFFPKEPSEQAEEDQGEKTGEAKAEEKGGEKGKGTPEVVIDLDGIMDRVVEFPVEAGDMTGLGPVKDKIFYLVAPPIGLAEGGGDEEEKPIYDLHVYNLKDEEDKVIEVGIDSYDLSADGKSLLIKRGEKFWTIKSDKTSKSDDDGSETTVDLSRWHLRIDPAQEFKQMFDEGWRLQRDFYWAPNMAGTDWNAVKAKYDKLLPRIATRADLNDLIGNLIGELSTSHTYIWGGDIKRPKSVPVGLLGVDVLADRGSGFYRITKIYPTEPSSPGDVSPLTLSHAGVKVGDYIVAVNGKPVKVPDDFYSAFVNLANEEVLLSVNGEPKTGGARDVIVKTVASESPVRYLDWVRTRRQYVEKATEGKCGYFHIPDMGSAGLVEFSRTFFPQMEKPAMIIDARYNGGGFVSEIIIERVGRELLAMGQSRRGVPYRYPEDAVYAHRVLLTNEEAGSDGDIFTRAFKLANLGPSVGMRTWGGVVGIRSDKPFVDGGMMTIPEFAWYEGEGWTLENRGAEPDVVVENLPGDEAAGIDRQIDKAIEIIKGDLERDPMTLPPLPPYPNKTLK